ncbi:PD-(D/E)XK nuclease family protein [Rathayibacter soli]|uniref:PD-(D/E)XK nuclease family protein n=1 Tax=Rathayibacter soli TaxID=3144168 RepID=UPI0027E558C5|nr:PD-(D/E)XK nuclease family protein [Glaciibacter superstes]
MTTTRFRTAPDAAAPAADSPGAAVTLDASQRTVVERADAASAVVIGAPGTGKTTTLIEVVADRVLHRGWRPADVLVLTTARTTATRLRDRLALRLQVATSGPIARTVNSIAFDIVRHAARDAGAQSPRLLTGGEQDSDIAQLLAGHDEDGSGPTWPDLLGPDVRRLRGFRTELRELMMRATEYGVTPERLAQLGGAHDRPEWIAAAGFLVDYYRVISSARAQQFDSAELVQFAVTALGAGQAPEAVAGLRLVLVDDVQELTTSGVALLRALAARGAAVIAFGDPDVAANAFRGGEPDSLGRMSELLGLPSLATLFLSSAYRHGAVLRALTQTVTERIGTAGIVGHRRAIAADPPDGVDSTDVVDPIVRIEAETPAREWAAIARVLREHHLLCGIDWAQMAVVVRSGAQVPAVARALALADVPTHTAVGGRPLRDDNAAHSLLTIIDTGIGRTALTPQNATAMLTGPFGGLDKLTLRRLRLALRAEELAGGGNRTGDDLLVDALEAPGRFTTIDDRVGRNAAKLAQTLHDLRQLAASGGSIEELLWLAWEKSGLASVWFDQALGSGIVATEANRNLDGILALFTAAKRFVERDPTAGATVFLDSVLDAEVPEDTLAPQAATEAVLVTTPQGVVGLEFEVVAVAGLQDGIWPNLRLRGSLLYPGQLVRVVTGLGDAALDGRKEVLGDELRMLALALSRARRQVILAAVSNEDESASVFFALLPESAVVVDSGRAPLSLRDLTGRLRRELTTPVARADRFASEVQPAAGRVSTSQRTTAQNSTGQNSTEQNSTEQNSTGRHSAAAGLAQLAAQRVPGADPADWHGLIELSTKEPLYLDEEPVPVSPSRLQAFEDSPLDWFIDTVSGSQTSTAMGIGTIVHWAMETATDATLDTVWASVQSRWNELLFESPWIAEQQQRAARILAAGVAEYLADFERDGKQLVAAERRFHLDVGRARVNGSIDRLERAADGGVVIVDLKTGAAITRQDEIDAHPQLGAYQLAYASGVLDQFLDELGVHHSGGAKLLYVKKGVRKKLYREAVQAPLTEEELEGFRTRIRQAAIGMAAAEFRGARELTQWGMNTAQRALHRVRAVSSD